MSIKIIDEIAPQGAGGFPLLDDQHLRGGFRQVADHAARDALPAAYRKARMWVVTQNDGKKWELGGDLTTWTEFTGGGGSSVAGTDGEGSLVEDHATVTGAVLDYASPRAMVSDGTHLYVGQSTQGLTSNAQGVLYRLALTGGTANTVDRLDLFAICGGNQVRDLAQDATYLYAAMWNNGNVAIIDKATFTVAGWFFSGVLGANAQSICADGAGHFFVFDVSNGSIAKIVTSTCLGAPPNVAYGGLIPVCAVNGRWVRFGGGKLWVTNGGSVGANALTRIDAAAMTVDTSAANVGGDTKAMIAVYDSVNSVVWVAMNSATARVYRVDPTTLAVIGSAVTPDHPSSTNFGTPSNLEFGHNAAGTPGAWLYVTSMSGKNAYPYFGAIDLSTFAWQGSHSVETNATDGYEGIAVLGNFVYFGRFDTAGLGITTGVDYYNPVTAAQGTVTAAAPTTTWGLRFTAIGGDITGPAASAAVVRLRGTALDAGLSGAVADGRVLTWSTGLGAWTAATPGTFVAGGDLTGTSSSQTVSAIQGVVISGAAANGQVLTATGPSAAGWATPAAGGGGTPGDDGTGVRGAGPNSVGLGHGVTSGFSGARGVVTNDSVSSVISDGEGSLLTLRGGVPGAAQFMYLIGAFDFAPTNHDGGGYYASWALDLGSAAFSCMIYAGWAGRTHGNNQFAFVGGTGGLRRVEFNHSGQTNPVTLSAAVDTMTQSGAFVGWTCRALAYSGDHVYAWDTTNGKIRQVTSPNSTFNAGTMVLSDLTANGSVPVGADRVTQNLMAFDGTNLWACGLNALYKITLGGVVTTYAFTGGRTGTGTGVFFDGRWLWVTANSTTRVDPAAADPANTGTAVFGGSLVNGGDVMGSDGVAMFFANSSLSSGVFNTIAVDPDSCRVVHEFQGGAHPACLSPDALSGRRSMLMCLSGVSPNYYGGVNRLYRPAPATLGSTRFTGSRHRKVTPVPYGIPLGSYHVQTDDDVVAVGGGVGPTNVILPTYAGADVAFWGNASTAGLGRELTILDSTGVNGTSSNSITVTPSSGETINGSSTPVVLSGTWAVLRLIWCLTTGGYGWVKV